MATDITALDVTENYASLTVLTQAELNEMADSLEDYINEKIRLNLIQLAKDCFTDAYVFNDDGVQSVTAPLVNAAAFLDEDETITGDWTFSGEVTFSDEVSSTSTFSSTGQDATAVYDAADQSIGDSAITALTFDSESYDRTDMHDTGTNTSRITIPAGATGVYLFTGQATFAASAVGLRKLMLYKSGSKIAEVKELGPDAAEQAVLRICEQVSATALDYYELKVYQTSGGALDVKAGAAVTNFKAIRMW